MKILDSRGILGLILMLPPPGTPYASMLGRARPRVNQIGFQHTLMAAIRQDSFNPRCRYSLGAGPSEFQMSATTFQVP